MCSAEYLLHVEKKADHFSKLIPHLLATLFRSCSKHVLCIVCG